MRFCTFTFILKLPLLNFTEIPATLSTMMTTFIILFFQSCLNMMRRKRELQRNLEYPPLLQSLQIAQNTSIYMISKALKLNVNMYLITLGVWYKISNAILDKLQEWLALSRRTVPQIFPTCNAGKGWAIMTAN